MVLNFSSSSFRQFWRASLLALGLAGMATHASANFMVPTLVVDADTGDVIESNQATRPWYPASTTKLMTAYVALRAIKSGTIKYETPIVVSPLAAKQRPSKIGVKPGQEVTLENALKFLMVKSANDIAVVVAEGVGGSVENFARMMNQESRRLGMRESNWTNPHGWEDARQYTSARDLAILARALLSEFPEASELWGIGALRLGQRVFNNTNGLVGRYSGAMGMKTGFICASGFNLVSAAQRNGRTLIAVVLGASNGADRTLKAAQLLDSGFNAGGGWGRATTGRSLEGLTASIETTAPNRRSEICRRGAPPASETEDLGALVATPFANDNPSSMVAMQRAPSESMAVGLRSGNAITLGPRASMEPLIVYLGKKPGSVEVARRAGSPAGTPERAQATAFAAQPGQRASGQPLTLPGAITAPARPGRQAAIAPRDRKLTPATQRADQKKLPAPKARASKKKEPPKAAGAPAKKQPPKAQAPKKQPKTASAAQ
ncbi:MAG: serine hydrolase [Rhabdaerophilum sp.]